MYSNLRTSGAVSVSLANQVCRGGGGGGFRARGRQHVRESLSHFNRRIRVPDAAFAAISLVRNSSTSGSRGEERSPREPPFMLFCAFWPCPPAERALE